MRKKLGKVLQVQKIVVPLQPQSREKATIENQCFTK